VVGPGPAELAAAMGTTSVVMGLVLGQDRPQMPLAEDQHPVGDLRPGREHEPFRTGIRARAPGRDFHGLDAGASQERVEARGELPGPVPDQESQVCGAIAEIHQEAADLLCGPRPVRVRGHAEDMHIPGADLDHEEAIQALQGHRAVAAGSARPSPPGRPSPAGAADGSGAARRPHAAAPRARRPWRPTTGRAGQAAAEPDEDEIEDAEEHG